MIRMTFAAGILGASLGLAAEPSRYDFTYSDADFRSVAAVKSTYQRIDREARRICPAYTEVRSARERQRCVEEVVADIVRRVNHPALTALAQGDDEAVRVALEEIAKPAGDSS